MADAPQGAPPPPSFSTLSDYNCICPWCGLVTVNAGLYTGDEEGPYSGTNLTCAQCGGSYYLACVVSVRYMTHRGTRKSDLPKEFRPKRKRKA